MQSLNVLLAVVYRALQAVHGLLFARVNLVAYELAIDQGQTRLGQGFFLIRQFRHQNFTAALVAVTMPVIVVSAFVFAAMAIEWPEEDDL